MTVEVRDIEDPQDLIQDRSTDIPLKRRIEGIQVRLISTTLRVTGEAEAGLGGETETEMIVIDIEKLEITGIT
jgi:hypothetical protein